MLYLCTRSWLLSYATLKGGIFTAAYCKAIYNDIEFYAIGYGRKDGDAEFSRLLSTEYYLKTDVDKILADLCENHKKASERDTENWNRLCAKYNKLIELKKDFCEKFKDIELEIDK